MTAVAVTATLLRSALTPTASYYYYYRLRGLGYTSHAAGDPSGWRANWFSQTPNKPPTQHSLNHNTPPSPATDTDNIIISVISVFISNTIITILLRPVIITVNSNNVIFVTIIINAIFIVTVITINTTIFFLIELGSQQQPHTVHGKFTLVLLKQNLPPGPYPTRSHKHSHTTTTTTSSATSTTTTTPLRSKTPICNSSGANICNSHTARRCY